MRRFLYAAAALLCLALGYHLVATPTGAGYIDHTLTGAVAMSTLNDDVFVLDENGVTWRLAHSMWERTGFDTLPVPVSDVKLWSARGFVTYDGAAWVALVGDGGHWSTAGQWPDSPSATQSATWGRVKADFR